jgi:hypothetical protein
MRDGMFQVDLRQEAQSMMLCRTFETLEAGDIKLSCIGEWKLSFLSLKHDNTNLDALPVYHPDKKILEMQTLSKCLSA